MTAILTAQHAEMIDGLMRSAREELLQRAAEDEVADRLYRLGDEALEAARVAVGARCPRLQRVCDDAVAAMRGGQAWMRGARD